MLKSFSVKRFRNLNLDNLEFNKVNLLIGPNNSGKTNLIEAIRFFSNLILHEKRDSAFHDELAQHGWDELLDRRFEKPGIIEMKWVIDTDPKYPELTYELNFRVGTADQIPRGFYITGETLRYEKPAKNQSRPFNFIECHKQIPGQGKFSVRQRSVEHGLKNVSLTSLDVNANDTVFNQLSNLLDSETFRMEFYPNFKQTVNTVQEFFKKFFAYSSTEFDLKIIREPAKIEAGSKYLKPDGSNFVNVLNYLDEQYDFLDAYTQYLRELIHDLDSVKIISVGDTRRALQLKIKGQIFKLHELSDGTIKAMLLTLLMWTPEKMTILALDEPELNLHPAWLKVISTWVERTDSMEQLFISSHSPDFLDGYTELFLKQKVDLLVFDLKEEPTVKVVKPDNLKDLLERGWEIGDLYRVGEPALGGWPW
ncbi:AAA family ATPase [Effusibacillus lacus]|uniref:Endonuclease GajA/Old nuclease/RecF-like AAA domain-containing protein n=1 Tax=Effusibacillus lacus TaxID=1348429 RepID=A0A292YQ14_9BACL|nr:AAA family ATPase [Effusibacillus lacus]TCS73761.1 putative ATPase [Effusibacillus lacus]GAX92028.1 hypothetical protein EFBL_3719 [Effusibacillus lacus]